MDRWRLTHLADLYLNGAGAKRDIPLAIRFACESEKGMAQLALPNLVKLEHSPSPKPFEICDYAASTLTQDFCAGYASEIKTDRRARYTGSLSSSMTAEQKSAFDQLLRAEHEYIAAHASEVDQGGSIHVIRTIGSGDILDDLFQTELTHFEAKEWPRLSAGQIATADTSLRRQYQQTLRALRANSGETYQGSVTPDGLAAAEKAWEAYREAWVAFARQRYPTAVAAIRAEITRRRLAFLKTIT